MVMLWEHLKSFWWFEHKGNRMWLWTPILLKKTYLFSVLYTGTPYKSKIATEQLKKKKKKKTIVQIMAQHISVVKCLSNAKFKGNTLKTKHKSGSYVSKRTCKYVSMIVVLERYNETQEAHNLK